jgi:hypothetical protein
LNTCLQQGDPDFEVTVAWHAYQQLRSMYQTGAVAMDALLGISEDEEA